jgi:hypothetical protein
MAMTSAATGFILTANVPAAIGSLLFSHQLFIVLSSPARKDAYEVVEE